ncbi:MAG: cyclic nucleotide-binding domain-containing protein, partial [Ramlibacter sp.]
MNIQQLVDAIATLDANDALTCKLTLEEWKKLAPYLSIRFLNPGDALMHDGDPDRELVILADGELLVTLGGSVLAKLTPGNVVGEGSFFSGQPRSATVS